MDATNPLIPHGGVVLEPLTTQRHLSSAETKPREASYKTLVISIIVTVSNYRMLLAYNLGAPLLERN